MPPIPVYSASPISAAKAPGATSEPPVAGDTKKDTAGAATSQAPTTTSAARAYAPAQPGAVPHLPVQTGAPQPVSAAAPPPTRTTQPGDGGPPPPRPGAAPVPPTTTTTSTSLPPPPKAGETYQPPSARETPTSTMPPQMGIPPPTTAYSGYQGTSSTASATTPAGSLPVDLSHPPGYQQNTASEGLSSYQQRSAHQTSMAEGGGLGGSSSGGGGVFDSPDDGVWDQAKKWASGVGGSLAAAESEVWKRINKN